MFDIDITKIVGVRLDNRLLHGVVATQWAPYVKCNRILIIDDKTAANELQKELMKLSRPANCSISILKADQAFENLISGKYKGQRILILIRNMDILVNLLKLPLTFPIINIGMYSATNGKISMSNYVKVSEEEYQKLKNLKDQGVRFSIQYVPSQKPVVI